MRIQASKVGTLNIMFDRAEARQHFGLDYSAEGQRYGIPLTLDGSSSTATQMDADRMRYRVIDVARGKFETRFVGF
jgi:ribose 1,5-bisphosphokinase PhnN